MIIFIFCIPYPLGKNGVEAKRVAHVAIAKGARSEEKTPPPVPPPPSPCGVGGRGSTTDLLYANRITIIYNKSWLDTRGFTWGGAPLCPTVKEHPAEIAWSIASTGMSGLRIRGLMLHGS